MKAWLAPVVLVLLANGIALFSAGRNRAEVRRELELSDRELWVQQETRDRSAIILNIRESFRVRGMDWLDNAKMISLGFRPIRSAEDAHQLGRRGFAALEFDGPEFGRYEAEATAVKMQQERASRLLVVDVSRDSRTLEEKYPDRNRHLIVRATVVPTWFEDSNKSAPATRRGLVRVNIPPVRVPNELRSVFAGYAAEPWRENRRGRFRATIRFGANYEPWVFAARRVNE